MSRSDGLESLLTPSLLSRLAGDTTFARGVSYAQEGRVQELSLTDGMLTARVAGTETYQVRLWKHGEEVAFDCTCPVGDALRFCKHGVAAGLAWLADAGVQIHAPITPVSRERSLERIAAFLHDLDEAALRELLLQEAQADERLRERLLIREAAYSADPAAIKRLRATIDRAADEAGYVDYDYGFSGHDAGLEDAVEGIATLAARDPAAAIELAEHAVQRVEEVLGTVDDSDGYLSDLLQRVQKVHLQACLAARPEPVALAGRLFEAEMESEFDAFYGAAGTYAEVLGKTGLAEYRRLAQAEWVRLPALGPGERNSATCGDRFRITSIMEALARVDGDLEALVAVKSRDLSHSHAFLQIAELYREAGEYDSAMEWARRGLDAFPGSRDDRLQLFLADEHHRRGEHGEAMELVWAAFSAWPAFEGYRLLHQHASRAQAWPAWRERALSSLRDRARKDAEKDAHHRWRQWTGSSELVRVFLWENDAEGAWREAQDGGCTSELWLELARKRESTHPADSLRVYRQQIDAILVDTGDRAYEAAVKLLPRVRETMARVDEDFDAYLAALRVTHKRRRKLMEMLDRFERRVAVRS